MLSSPFVDLLVFIIGDQRFGMPVADVREIVRAARYVRLPAAPPVVEGALNYRGEAVAVIDIRVRFRLPPKAIEITDHLIVAKAGSRTVAIRVDQVIDLITVPTDTIEDVAAVTPNGAYVAGVAKLPDGILLIHRLALFLSEAEAESLDQLEEQLQL